MDYESDTLTSAKNNRAASEKFYKQVMPSRSLVSLCTDLPTMLHRSPSGAKRKIRQRAEQCGSRPSPFLPKSVDQQPAPSPTPSEVDSYRSLKNSDTYQSILPELEYPPKPAPRLSQSFSTSLSSLENISPSPTQATMSSTAIILQTPPQPPPQKPTVEVHPMPSEDRKDNRDRDVHFKREKPAVPAKPKGLKLNIEPIARSTSLTSLVSSSAMTQSTMFMNSLFASPSFCNLQQAYKNPDLGSQELNKLEDQRVESISTVNRRVSVLEDEKSILDEEMCANEETATRLLQIVEHHDPGLAAKVHKQMEHNKDLLRLEAKLRCQIERINQHLRDNNSGMPKSDLLLEETRLRRRINEISLLRQINARRERDIECSLARVFEEDQSRQWHQYKDNLVKMIQESRQIEQRITDSRMQIRALHNTRPTTTTTSS